MNTMLSEILFFFWKIKLQDTWWTLIGIIFSTLAPGVEGRHNVFIISYGAERFV